MTYRVDKHVSAWRLYIGAGVSVSVNQYGFVTSMGGPSEEYRALPDDMSIRVKAAAQAVRDARAAKGQTVRFARYSDAKHDFLQDMADHLTAEDAA